jgi:tripartite-type tricarboxylate transporter receptor subunit TctC
MAAGWVPQEHAMNRRDFLRTTLTSALGLGTLARADAQSDSSRPIRLIIPSAPGSALDPYARLISDHMSRTLARIVIVESKPGASGNIAAQLVAHAPADGNTIWVATQSATEINPSAYSEMKWSLTDFIPLIRGVEAPLVLVTHPSVPATTLAGLVEWIKRNPGKLGYSSYTAGTPSHFLGFQMAERFGLDLVHVPSRGSGAQATDLMAGHVLFGFAQLQSALPLINAGKLNAVAITSLAKSRFLPEVPTFAELGHPDFTANIWFGLMVRAQTPPTAVDSLLRAARSAHADPDVRAKLERQGFEISGQSGPQFTSDIVAQIERWARLVKASGFKAEGSQ